MYVCVYVFMYLMYLCACVYVCIYVCFTPRFFEDEAGATSRKHDEAGLVSMANMGVPNTNGSQFFFSMRGDDMQHLDGKHAVFAKV